jgi:hypothetical protein
MRMKLKSIIQHYNRSLAINYQSDIFNEKLGTLEFRIFFRAIHPELAQ